MVRQVRRRLQHAPGVAGGAQAKAFAGEGHELVVAAVAIPCLGKTVRNGAALEVFAKRLAHNGLGVWWSP